jgi:hypothetical protein
VCVCVCVCYGRAAYVAWQASALLHRRYSIYLLCCYKRKNTEADKTMAGKAAGKAAEAVGLATTKLSNSKSLGTESAGFTGTKVQIVWHELPRHRLWASLP